MKNHYKDMMEKIKVPNSLKDKVLDAACTVQPEIAESTRHPRRHTVFRVAVCTACTFAILLGGLSFFKLGSDRTNNAKGTDNSLAQAYHFGLVAYASDINETFTPRDNKIAFSIADSGGGEVLGKGDYTGCLFRVTGDGIKEVSVAIDHGGLYKYIKLTNLTKDNIKAIYASEANGTLKADCQFASSDDEKTWCSEQMTALGSSFSENWTADSSYGFWVPPKLIQHSADKDLKEAAYKNIDTFNGATLTITATFDDGSQQTKTLHLKTGKLKVVNNENHTHTVLPELATGNDSYVYSVYAEFENCK
jgi:hypothetical protein